MIETASSTRRDARGLFVATLLTGSFLLFLMQPLVARFALPRLGGAPAVWNSAMLVYQALLLVGYLYAHLLGRLAPRAQAAVHVGALALALMWLPIGLAAGMQPAGWPTALWVPWLFARSIGPLFVVVAAQAPLMQRWYAGTTRGHDPYWLYAASNLGSFGGLIAYPLLFEPLLTLRSQAFVWSTGYVLLVALVAACGAALWRVAPGAAAAREAALEPAPSLGRRLRWIALAAVPCGLMLSSTTRLTTDVGAVPLFWVLPLGLYLLSFSIAFSSRPKAGRRIARALPFAIAAAGLTAFSSVGGHPVWSGATNLILLFVAAVALHRELYRLRPEPARLTGFYLAMAAGGALGGAFCASAAPALFDWTYEHPILIVAAALLVTPRPPIRLVRLWWADRQGRAVRRLMVAVAAVVLSNLASGLFVAVPWFVAWLAMALLMLLLVFAAGQRWVFALTALALMLAAGGWQTLQISFVPGMRTRSYFGVYTIVDRADRRQLVNGTTLHGVQLKPDSFATFPTSYYAPGSGIGQAMRMVPALYGPHARIGVVGLGAGTLACFHRPGQDWRFYEIDPADVAIAENPKQFVFLSRCAPGTPILLGDARLTLAEARPAGLDLIAVDAFSSDAVPTHLLTTEAFAIYARALAPRGLLMMHVSNRFMDLSKVVAAAAAQRGWHAAIVDYKPSQVAETIGATRSIWIALSPDTRAFDRLVHGGDGWARLDPTPGFAPWTDDHMSVLTVLKPQPWLWPWQGVDRK